MCVCVFSSTGRSASHLRVGREERERDGGRQWCVSGSVECCLLSGENVWRFSSFILFVPRALVISASPRSPVKGPWWLASPPQVVVSSGARVVRVRWVLFSFCSCFSLIGLFLFIMMSFLFTQLSLCLSPFPGDIYSFCSPFSSVTTSGGNKVIENHCFVFFFETSISHIQLTPPRNTVYGDTREGSLNSRFILI